MHRLALACPLLLLSACGQSDSDPGPGGVTVGEARALDEAAEMIEQRRLPPGTAATPPATGTERAGQEARAGRE
jgi:hypothetical protein